MSKDLFNTIALTKYYLDNSKYKKPLKINFVLKEISQTKENDLVYVDLVPLTN